jgi:DNA-binding transcriptional ArsR family regulator
VSGSIVRAVGNGTNPFDNMEVPTDICRSCPYSDLMSWTDQPAADRVRWVAESLAEPRTAHWVAEEADVSPSTARKYLERLADDRRLTRSEDGNRTLYAPDRVTQYLDEVREAYDAHTADELTEALLKMRERIDSWRAEFGVSTPNELRATVTEVDREAAERRREVAIEWEHLESRIDVLEDALSLYDRFPAEPEAPA